MPHSKFLSWPEDDQDKVLSSMIEDLAKCPSCGTNPDEWFDEKKRPIEPAPYQAVSIYCPGCQALDEKRDEVPEDRRQFTHVFLSPLRLTREEGHEPGPAHRDVGRPGRDHPGVRSG